MTYYIFHIPDIKADTNLTRPLSRFVDQNGIPYWMTNGKQARVVLDGLYALFHHVRMEGREEHYDGPVIPGTVVQLPEDLTGTTSM
jgi:hypothetical protein